jgi:hypothetical protein
VAINPKLIGAPVGSQHVLISSDKLLEKSSGKVIPIDPSLVSNSSLSDPVIITKEVEVVVGVDGQKIDLSLATSAGPGPIVGGFLVEVYLSGADGKLTRVYRDSAIDVLNDEVLSDGFSDYLVLEVDK